MLQLERYAHTALFRPDESECQGFFDQLVEALEAAFGLALADEPSQSTDDLASALRLSDRLLHHLADAFAAADTGSQKLATGFQIIRHRGQWLVKLVRHCRGHLPHDGEPRGVQQLGLKILNAALGLLALGQIADEAGKITAAREGELANLQLHRKGLSPPCANRRPHARCR